MTIRKSRLMIISFAAVDSSNRPVRKSGLSFVAGDVKISQNGGVFANITTLPSEIGSSGRYKLDLSSAEIAADFVHITVEKAGMDPVDIMVATGGQPAGTVVADGGNTASTFKTDRAELTNDHWKDALLLFTTGPLAEQVKKVTAYNGTTKFVTLASAFTGAPSTGDRFVLINL